MRRTCYYGAGRLFTIQPHSRSSLRRGLVFTIDSLRVRSCGFHQKSRSVLPPAWAKRVAAWTPTFPSIPPPTASQRSLMRSPRRNPEYRTVHTPYTWSGYDASESPNRAAVSVSSSATEPPCRTTSAVSRASAPHPAVQTSRVPDPMRGLASNPMLTLLHRCLALHGYYPRMKCFAPTSKLARTVRGRPFLCSQLSATHG